MQVLLELRQLLHSFRGGGSSRARRLTWQFLAARGYQQEFNALDSELQARVAQLAACMHFFHFARQVGCRRCCYAAHPAMVLPAVLAEGMPGWRCYICLSACWMVRMPFLLVCVSVHSPNGIK
jgi:hypothetical protein